MNWGRNGLSGSIISARIFGYGTGGSVSFFGFAFLESVCPFLRVEQLPSTRRLPPRHPLILCRTSAWYARPHTHKERCASVSACARTLPGGRKSSCQRRLSHTQADVVRADETRSDETRRDRTRPDGIGRDQIDQTRPDEIERDQTRSDETRREQTRLDESRHTK